MSLWSVDLLFFHELASVLMAHALHVVQSPSLTRRVLDPSFVEEVHDVLVREPVAVGFDDCQYDRLALRGYLVEPLSSREVWALLLVRTDVRDDFAEPVGVLHVALHRNLKGGAARNFTWSSELRTQCACMLQLSLKACD